MEMKTFFEISYFNNRLSKQTCRLYVCRNAKPFASTIDYIIGIVNLCSNANFFTAVLICFSRNWTI